jgi:serine protease inhibitor
LPKFTLEYEKKLNDVLSAMGMDRAFSDHAEFPHISPTPLKIDQVIHKTFVKVDEEGTEAAAVTSVDMGPTSLPPSFIFNRPFVFVIQESHSGTLLFMGRIVEPLAD